MNRSATRWFEPALLGMTLLVGSCTTESLARRGRQALGAGDEREAARLLARAATNEPENAEIWKDLARAHFRSGLLQDAQAAIDRAVALRPVDPETVLLRGQIRMNRGERAPAMQDGRWVAQHTSNPVLLQQVAILLLRGGQTEDSLGAARKAVRTSKDDGDAYVNLAVLAAEAHEPKVVETTLRTGLERHPDHVALRQTWAAWLVSTERHAQARLEYEGLLRHHPEPALIHLALALLAHTMGDLGPAFVHARIAFDVLGSSRADVNHTYGVILRDRGDLAEARRHLERARRRFPSDERLRDLESTLTPRP